MEYDNGAQEGGYSTRKLDYSSEGGRFDEPSFS